MAFGVETAVSVVRIFARQIVFVRQVIARIDRTAVGTLGLEITRMVAAHPGIKAAVFEDRRPAAGATLVAVGEVGLGQFCVGKLRPEDLI